MGLVHEGWGTASASRSSRPKVSQESTRLGLDRTELGAFLVQAGLSGGNPHSLRPAAITAALDAGCSLRNVQDFARHADPR
jgi:integrase/recombinase XerD